MVQKNYLAIAKKKVTTVQKSPRLPSFLIYARNKKGKSTFGVSAGRAQTLVLDPEYGTDQMKKLNPYIWPITKWEDMDEAWGALRTGKLSPKLLGVGPEADPFKWVSVDGTTRINNMALRYVMRKSEEVNLDRRPGMVDRRDYNKSGELMKQMLLNFHTLHMGVIYTAQERIISADSGDAEDEEESTFFVPDLPAAVRGAVNSIVDVIGRLYVTKVNVKRGKEIVEVNQRRLWIGTHERYDTGYRSDFELPDLVKRPTIPKLVSLVHTGKEE